MVLLSRANTCATVSCEGTSTRSCGGSTRDFLCGYKLKKSQGCLHWSAPPPTAGRPSRVRNAAVYAETNRRRRHVFLSSTAPNTEPPPRKKQDTAGASLSSCRKQRCDQKKFPPVTYGPGDRLAGYAIVSIELCLFCPSAQDGVTISLLSKILLFPEV